MIILIVAVVVLPVVMLALLDLSSKKTGPPPYFPSQPNSLPGWIVIVYYGPTGVESDVRAENYNASYPASVLSGVGDVERFNADFQRGWAYYMPQVLDGNGHGRAWKFDPRSINQQFCRMAFDFVRTGSGPDPGTIFPAPDLFYADARTRSNFLAVTGPIVTRNLPLQPVQLPSPRNAFPVTTAVVGATVALHEYNRAQAAKRGVAEANQRAQAAERDAREARDAQARAEAQARVDKEVWNLNHRPQINGQRRTGW